MPAFCSEGGCTTTDGRDDIHGALLSGGSSIGHTPGPCHCSKTDNDAITVEPLHQPAREPGHVTDKSVQVRLLTYRKTSQANVKKILSTSATQTEPQAISSDAEPERDEPSAEDPILESKSEVAVQTDLTCQDLQALQDDYQKVTSELITLKSQKKSAEMSELSLREDPVKVAYYTGLPNFTVLVTSVQPRAALCEAHTTELVRKVRRIFGVPDKAQIESAIPGHCLPFQCVGVHYSVGLYCARLHIPAFTKGKRQLSAVDVESTRKLANVRIYIERVIGLVRNKYVIMKSVLPLEYATRKPGHHFTPLDKIVTVCCALTNFCQSVVPANPEPCG
ncbi:hypothetical protein MTO96_033546 [Rhipicephalus appendiculatus]